MYLIFMIYAYLSYIRCKIPHYTIHPETIITFESELGDVPMLSSANSNVYFDEIRKGTKENLECSRRGLCGKLVPSNIYIFRLYLLKIVILLLSDHTNGRCICFTGFGSSDGNGNLGARGDCGAFLGGENPAPAPTAAENYPPQLLAPSTCPTSSS
jgi:hypothetical protein